MSNSARSGSRVKRAYVEVEIADNVSSLSALKSSTLEALDGTDGFAWLA